jgi:hypothetical protein
MITRSIPLWCLVLVAAACSAPDKTVAPMFKVRDYDQPASAQLQTPIVTYRVQAFTSFQGQIYNIPACLVYSWMTWNHNIDPNTVHTDSIMAVQQNGSCGAPSPWNGGWIDVYEVRPTGDKIVGQVYGDLVWKDFSYTGPDYLQIKLKAFPDQTRNCQFLYFDNYPPGQSVITVIGQGDLPLAQFYCN